ncbi:hypothetical protein LTS08_000139 [Lithohypha guttulata]|nr:hypothetical protein LTS08_000139 [Lithohypha guttulata]
MAGETPEKGDKVSWNYGGGAPGGTVAETKTEGDVAIKSKRGNTIKKKAEPNNPAVHIERSGNDVVKKASELNIDKKASGAKSKAKDDKKRKADDEEEKEEEETKDDDKHEEHDGKEVRKGGKTAKASAATKKQKKTPEPAKEEEKEKDKKKTPEPAKEKKETKKDEPKQDTEKKAKGRPKGTTTAAKKDKETAPRAGGDLVSTRTRSQAKK